MSNAFLLGLFAFVLAKASQQGEAPNLRGGTQPCVDVEPPSSWMNPTCALQLANGGCAQREALDDGFCQQTCGLCALPCKDWCASTTGYQNAGAGWSKKCNWKLNCAGCAECESQTPAPTPRPTPRPTARPTMRPTAAPMATPAPTVPPTQAGGVEKCISEQISFKRQKIQICYRTSFHGPTAAVFTFDWGAKALIWYPRFMKLGYIGISVVVEKWVACNYNMHNAFKWLQQSGNAFLAKHNTSGDIHFTFNNMIFIAGYSRAAICAVGSAEVSMGSQYAPTGVIALGAWRFVGAPAKYGPQSPEILSFSCGTDEEETNHDYRRSVRNKIAKIKTRMAKNEDGTERFIDMNWDDCNHVRYLKHKKEILTAEASFLKKLDGHGSL